MRSWIERIGFPGFSRAPRERGTVTVFTALILVALLGAAALSIDLGLVLTTRGQLQNAADSAALAAMNSLREQGSFGQATSAATDLAEQHRAGGKLVDLDRGDVTIGHYSFASGTFTPGVGFGAPAVHVVARRSQGSPAGPLPLFFAPVLGRFNASVSAEAVAASRRRDLVLSQDRTASFVDEFPAAQDADQALVAAMEAQGFGGDRVGLVSFARDTTREASLTPLTGGGTTHLLAAIDGMDVCTSGGRAGGPCYGTDIGAGIDAARTLLEAESTGGDAERVIVVVSDGTPCFLEHGSRAVSRGQAAATAAANRAGAAGINVFVVTLDVPGGGSGPCMSGDVRFNESLARGYGKGFTTTEEEDLDDLLVGITRQIPIYLVE